MPKILKKEYFDSLVSVIAGFPKGALIGEIISALDTPPPKRTLQNHLSKLIDQDRITSTGKGVATRYHVPMAESEETEGEPKSALKPIPLSDQALEVKKQVSEPLNTRTPVGYSSSFLGDYEPNQTFYLSKNIRNTLSQLGSASDGHQPAGTYILKIYNRIMIDLSWNSSRLEGNTYSLLETERLIELGENAEGKNADEAQMILNHKAAIELLCDQEAQVGFNRYTICNLHALLSDNLLPDPLACGKIRTMGVRIGGSVFHPSEVPQTIEECFDSILHKADAIEDPFEQAFFVMVHLPYLQPFEDVNKRVSRFAANIPLITNNLCPLSFVDVPEDDYIKGTLGVYELNSIEYLRDVFIWAYKRSCARYSAVRQSLGEPDPFRLTHRELIKSTVYEIVQARMTKTEAVASIKNAISDSLAKSDHNKLIEIIETELISLHEGNIARFRLRPSEYEEWKKNWR